MYFLTTTKLLTSAIFIFLCQPLLEAGPVRLSFLQEADSLEDTFEFLTNNGCAEPATTAFQRVVRQYCAEPFDFNYDKFPRLVSGFYLFSSPQELIAALPHRLPDTQHSFGFNCMDAVIVLSNGQLKTGLRPDEIFGPFMPSVTTTNGDEVHFAATPRDAFNLTCPPWYQEATEPLIPASMRDGRICLTAALFRWHLLPISTKKENLEIQVLEVLHTTWQHEKVSFPDQFEVVLLHSVDFSAHAFYTCHAGLLFHPKTGYTYIEKAGGWGPFVRLDLTEKSDLLPWLARSFKDYTNPNFIYFATFNNGEIKKLNPK